MNNNKLKAPKNLAVTDAVREAQNVQKLPEFCYVLNETGRVGERIVIQRNGDFGQYTPFMHADGDAKTPIRILKQVVIELNEKLGVSVEQMVAMHAGALFGFHVPMADPNSAAVKKTAERFRQEASGE